MEDKKISNADVEEYRKALQKQTDKKFGRLDADEGSWVEVLLVNRTTEYMPPFAPMLTHDLGSLDEKEAHDELMAAAFNLEVANGAFSGKLRWYRHARMFKPCDCFGGYVSLPAKPHEKGSFRIRKGKWTKSEKCPKCEGKSIVLRGEE